MRFSIITTILTAALAIAAPSPKPSGDTDADASPVEQVLSVFQGFQQSLTMHADNLQAAAAAFNSGSTQADKDAAAATVSTEFSAITSDIRDATSKLGTSPGSAGAKIKARDIQDVINDLIEVGSEVVRVVFSAINIGLSVPVVSPGDVFSLVEGIIGLVQAGIKLAEDLAPLLQPLVDELLRNLFPL